MFTLTTATFKSSTTLTQILGTIEKLIISNIMAKKQKKNIYIYIYITIKH